MKEIPYTLRHSRSTAATEAEDAASLTTCAAAIADVAADRPIPRTRASRPELGQGSSAVPTLVLASILPVLCAASDLERNAHLHEAHIAAARTNEPVDRVVALAASLPVGPVDVSESEFAELLKPTPAPTRPDALSFWAEVRALADQLRGA